MQIEAALALDYYRFNSNEMAKFNKLMNHDSHTFYMAIIEYFENDFGDLPSKILKK